MNKLFGFFKQKIIEVKEQNKQQLQSITQALNEGQYSTEKVLGMLQNVKSNYLNWNILIANEASTGLYYSQVHNRNICLKKIKGNKQLLKNCEKSKIKLQQIEKTRDQIKEISGLNGKWVTQVNNDIEKMLDALYKLEKQEINNSQQKQINFDANNEETQKTISKTEEQSKNQR